MNDGIQLKLKKLPSATEELTEGVIWRNGNISFHGTNMIVLNRGPARPALQLIYRNTEVPVKLKGLACVSQMQVFASYDTD